MKICFATNNPNKLREIAQMLPDRYQLIGLKDIGFQDEIPEDQDTIAGNSEQKARFILDRFQINCFADDTGLEVEALNGDPGVYSARYGGPERSAERNIGVLLKNLTGKSNRKAQFVTVITLILDETQYQFEGVVKGTIIDQPRGTNGFGYDPIFVPEGYEHTFAEMDALEKNKISHRARAVEKLVQFLQNQGTS